jgi:phospholipid-binding lipoprotein MlaA
MNDFRRSISVFVIALTLTGCATTNDPRDPFEGFNRAMFSFNDAIDQTALKPAATVYQNMVPMVVQIGVGNFFGNIGDVWTAANNLMQGKLADGFTDIMRVAVNSTFGLAGLIDIGADVGMTKHKEDFGQTLGVWGVASGPYVVLPFLGPTTLRDSIALPVDAHGDLWSYKDPVRVRNAGAVLRVVDQRSVVLDATNLIEDAALDRYEFVRDGFLQRRENNVNDGGSRRSRLDDQSKAMTHEPVSLVWENHYKRISLHAAELKTEALEDVANKKRDGESRADLPPMQNDKLATRTTDSSDRIVTHMSNDADRSAVNIE